MTNPPLITKKLTPKQEAALLDARQNGGQLFQVPERGKHHPNTLSRLVKAGLLKAEPVGTVWTLTEAGQTAVTQIY